MTDPKSYELAEHFLEEFGTVAEALTMQLAQAIQNAAEDWITDATSEGLIAEETREERDRRLGLADEDDEPEGPDPDRLREDEEERRALSREAVEENEAERRKQFWMGDDF